MRARPVKYEMHGMAKTPIYKVWNEMVRRCCNPKHRNYKHYGARGITVDPAWLSFKQFYEDMGEPNGLELERRNNDLGYSPDNCYWASRTVQTNNSRRNVKLTWEGQTKNVTQWAKDLGCDPNVIFSRIRYGWSVKETLTTPVGKYVRRT